jgi:hypothetical protein
MKILFVADGIHAYASGAQQAVGGAERQQWYLARALAESGWKVVVGLRDTLQPGDRCAHAGVEFVGMQRGQMVWAWRRFLDAERPDWCYWRAAGGGRFMRGVWPGPTESWCSIAASSRRFRHTGDRRPGLSRAWLVRRATSGRTGNARAM